MEPLVHPSPLVDSDPDFRVKIKGQVIAPGRIGKKIPLHRGKLEKMGRLIDARDTGSALENRRAPKKEQRRNQPRPARRGRQSVEKALESRAHPIPGRATIVGRGEDQISAVSKRDEGQRQEEEI